MATQAAQLRYFCSNTLHLMILPTEACNFRCTYCYETFEHKKMPRRVVAGIKALIDRRGGDLNELRVSWFGGEPLLAFDIVTEICEHASRVAKSRGFVFVSDLTTNAYFLDRKRFSSCLENGIFLFQITLDGGRDVHNASRRLASGAGTFDRIWTNVMEMKTLPDDYTIILRLHYVYENFRSVAAFGRTINDVLGDDPRFRFAFQHIARLGGPNDENITSLTREEEKVIEAWMWKASGLRQLPLSADVDVCYAAMGNSLVIRSTGRLAKCTVALTEDYNDIGFIEENGDVCVDQEKYRHWIAPLAEGRWAEAKCPQPWVAGETDLDFAPLPMPRPLLPSADE